MPAGFPAREAVPPLGRLIPYRFLEQSARDRLDVLYLRAVQRERPPVIAYLWPDAPLSLIEALRATGAVLIREMINCFRGTAKRILDRAYGEAGLAPDHGITQESVEAEIVSLRQMDWVFASNPCVEQSLVEAGVDPTRILPVTFGWDPHRFVAERAPANGFTALFVGRLCVRKGTHLLLDAWAESDLSGRLILAGAIEPALLPLIRHHLERPDVWHVGFVDDVAAVFKSADLLCFPTLEEGGPMVTYEAAGCGLAILTSPMGAARIVDDRNGRVVDPNDRPAMVAALRLLAGDEALRHEMGRVSIERAASFTWSKVGRRRGELMSRLVDPA